jgi:hypothetical protein
VLIRYRQEKQRDLFEHPESTQEQVQVAA